MKRVVVFGPGPKYKGGLANYTTSLAKAFDALEDTEVYLFSWTSQYPAIIPRDFIDRKSRTDHMEGTNIKVEYHLNYNNPLTWQRTYKRILEVKPDVVVFQWSIAIQGLPLGYVAKKLSKHKDIEVVFDLHFVIQKEQSSLDMSFTKRGIKHADSYVVHALKTANELKELFPNRNYLIDETGKRAANKGETVIKLYHPVYDMFQPDPNFDMEGMRKKHNVHGTVFLFFGFIRKYKGLHHVIKSYAELLKETNDASLLIVGESFWNTLDNKKLSTRIKSLLFGTAKKIFLGNKEDEKDYNPLALLDELGIRDKVTLVNEYVPHEEVAQYWQMSDATLLFYEYATPSGVESMAYNFNMPILATNVGHFPETVKDGYNGYLAEAEDITSMKNVMKKFMETGIPRENVAATAAEMSWENYARAILNQ